MAHFDGRVNNTVHEIYQSVQNQMLTEHKVDERLVWTKWSVGLTKNSYLNRQVKTENVIIVEIVRMIALIKHKLLSEETRVWRW